MKPTVGRIVHYVQAGGEHVAAIVTRVWDGRDEPLIQATVFNPAGENYTIFAPGRDERTMAQGTWHWPERDDTAFTREDL